MSSTMPAPPISFGVMTPPQQVAYEDLRRVWREADAIEEIDHLWLFDHLMPIGGDPNGPMFEGWSLLAALAAQTERARLGLMVTSNRIRPPALLAKIAATVDIVSHGRLEFGIGIGSRPQPPEARREYPAHGLPFDEVRVAADKLAEACTIIRRLWTSDEPFDFDGEHVSLRGAFCNPKPLQRPHPPFVIAGRTTRAMRIAAAHADVWNVAGELEDCVARSARLDELCAELGRDPAEITRSIPLRVDPGALAGTRAAAETPADAGFSHFVLGLAAPYPDGILEALRDEVIAPVRASDPRP